MTMTVKVGGMRCEHCKARIEKSLAAEGWTATADLAAATVCVQGDGLTADLLKNAVEDLGFDYLGEAE
ncbi:MAG: heavy-metal-associated domain-containing protein [Clostridia bacterium]|nr:heavy-metal-associated domain-containing protein [Clostridia bacterium]